MILGEAGTYKEQMANLLYTNGNRSNSPLVAIDCARLHDKGRTFLVENDNSPFADSDITIHMKNMKSISDKQFEELLRFMKDAGVQERNRLLFTFPYSEIRGVEERCQSLINTFSCSAIFMPTLRNHKSDIPNLASLYISMLNMQMAKEIVGFEPKALESLQTYDWPYNFDQFTRVLQELVSVTDTSYIRHSDTEKLLKQENKLFYSSADPVNGGIDLNRTLEEITLDIVHRVLMEEHGNQSATAKRLGISRTTLWRMLQNSGSM